MALRNRELHARNDDDDDSHSILVLSYEMIRQKKPEWVAARP